MTTPQSPLDKKDQSAAPELTLDQRVNRLEHTIENAFNYLAKGISEVELKVTNENKDLQTQLSKTLTLMNMSTLQNIITIRETLRVLIEKDLVDAQAFEAQVTAELTKAIEAQQKAILEQQDAQAEETQEVATEDSGATA
jgi:hypothetical protein